MNKRMTDERWAELERDGPFNCSSRGVPVVIELFNALAAERLHAEKEYKRGRREMDDHYHPTVRALNRHVSKLRGELDRVTGYAISKL